MVDHLEQLLRQARTDREEDEEETLSVPGDRDPGPPPARPEPGAGEAAELPRSPAGQASERKPPLREDGGQMWRPLRTVRALPDPAPDEAAPGGVAEELLDQADIALPPVWESGTANLDGPALSLPILSVQPGQAIEAESGLYTLYRGARAETWSGNAVQKAGVTVVRESALPEGEGLTMGRLDRAVRRDSRRYDGGMSIY